MPRHAKTKARASYRSPSAVRAYRTGSVTHVIDLERSAEMQIRQRATATLTRHAIALGVVGAAFWIYDLGLLLHH